MEAKVFIHLTDVRRDAFHFGVPNRISRNYQYMYENEELMLLYHSSSRIIMLCTRGLNPLQYLMQTDIAAEKWQLEDHSSSFRDDIFSGAILY